MRPAQSLGLILGLSSVVAAWPSFLPPRDSLMVRQNDDDSNENANDNAGTGNTDTDNTDADTADDNNDSNNDSNNDEDSPAVTAAPEDEEDPTITPGPKTGNLNTGSVLPTGSDGEIITQAPKGNSTKKEVFDQRSPVGAVVMMEPITTTMVLYKLGDFVSMKWNYTNLLADPTAVDVLAVDSAASQTHTLTQNMTFEIPASFTWDTEKYQEENAATKGLRVAEYTLVIHDSEGSPTDTADAGYLAPYNQLQFGIYTPQPYVDINDWVCAVCNSAPGALVASAAGFAVTLAFGAGVAVAVL